MISIIYVWFYMQLDKSIFNEHLFILYLVQFLIMKHQHIFLNMVAGPYPANNILIQSLLNCI